MHERESTGWRVARGNGAWVWKLLVGGTLDARCTNGGFQRSSQHGDLDSRDSGGQRMAVRDRHVRYLASRSPAWSAPRRKVTTGRPTLQPDGGRTFREGWITGVRKHFHGEPKPGYVSPWDDTPDWERTAAAFVYEQVRAFIDATDGRTSRLSRTQKGHFVAIYRIGQNFKHIPDPKPSYVADWDELPAWQQETNADIFELIERQAQSSA
jgi:hypothetical protein